ncbi:MAG: squalene/phytoene synthase family protein [Parvularcula sp.]
MRSARPDELTPAMWRAVAAAEPDHVASLAYYPSVLRPPAAAVLAYAVELRAVGVRTSEPTLGDIRLAWWREAVGAIFAEQPPEVSHPVLAAMTRTLRGCPSLAPALLSLIDAAAVAPVTTGNGHFQSDAGRGFDGELAYALAQLCGADEPMAARLGAVGALYGAARQSAAHANSPSGDGLAAALKQAIADLAPFAPSLAPILAALKGGIPLARGRTLGPFRRRLSQFQTVLNGR